MLIVQILLGGITRLTGSGLSITEWDVVTGTLPPLNHQQWVEAFEKYKQTPQYGYLNSDFTLNNFKFIFFLGMVSPVLGSIAWCGIPCSVYHISLATKVQARYGPTTDHTLPFGCIAGCSRLDNGC